MRQIRRLGQMELKPIEAIAEVHNKALFENKTLKTQKRYRDPKNNQLQFT